jgi:hypothetical protein
MHVSRSMALKMIVIGGLLGAILAWCGSLLFDGSYSSTAVMAISAANGGGFAGHLQQLSLAVRRRTVLTTIIVAHDLFPGERARLPVEDVIATMNKKIEVEPLSAVEDSRAAGAFKITFTYPDAFKAQQVTQDLVTRYMDENIRETEGENTLRVVDLASLPQRPVTPEPLPIAGAGMAVGAALGGLGALFRRRKPEFALDEFVSYLERGKTLDEFLADHPATSRGCVLAILKSLW